MLSRYTRTGKEILLDQRHFADAVDETAAMQILNALRAIEEAANRRVSAPVTLNDCRVMRQGDEMACACGLRWEIGDPRPPLCVHRAPTS